MARPEPTSWSKIALVGLAVLAGLAGLAYLGWASGATGASCTTDQDCHTRACLLGPGGEGVCTEVCHGDEGCPDDMRCGTAMRDRAATPGGSRERHVCVPAD